MKTACFSKINFTSTVLLKYIDSKLYFIPLSKICSMNLSFWLESAFASFKISSFQKTKIYPFIEGPSYFAIEIANNPNYKNINKWTLINSLNEWGLNVIIDRGSLSRVKKEIKKINLLQTQFNFKPQETELMLAGSNTIDTSTSGPFIEDEYKNQINQNITKLTKLNLLDKTKPFFLHQFQAEDAARIACKSYGYIGHEQGLGKTAIAIATSLLKGGERVLIVAPSIGIGTQTSGWKFEIHRFGIPKENIHEIVDAEDLPQYTSEVKNNFPHYYLVSYSNLVKNKKIYAQFQCGCGTIVYPKDKGMCPDYDTNKWSSPHLKLKSGKHCPKCDISTAWNGRICDPNIGGCGFKLWEYALSKDKEKRNKSLKKAIISYIRPRMFTTLLLDESHLIRNPSTKRSQAVRSLKDFKNTYIITGTIMTNFIKDIYWQLIKIAPNNLLPIDYGSSPIIDIVANGGDSKFLEKFQGFKTNRSTRYPIHFLKHPKEFWNLLSSFMVRRDATDSLIQQEIKLPTTIFHKELVEMDDFHQYIYNIGRVDFRNKIHRLLKNSNQTNVSINDLLGLQPVEVNSNLLSIRQICAVPSMDITYKNKNTGKELRILELVKNQMKNRQKTVIFCHWKEEVYSLQKFLSSHNIPILMVTSNTSLGEKLAAIDAWRISDDHWVLLTTTGCLGTAINLTPLATNFECNGVIFTSPEITPTIIDQAWKRVNRIGQRTPVDVFFMLNKGSIEEFIYEQLLSRRSIIANAIDRKQASTEDEVIESSIYELTLRVLAENKE